MMDKYRFLIIGFVLMILNGCASIKNDLNQSGGQDEAIQNAILDFSKTKLYKKDSVFSISFYDTIGRMVLENNEWISGEAYKSIVAVRISANYNQFLVTEDTKVGSSNSKLPTRFIQREGKLFYWSDKESPLTEEALMTYEKYNLLQDDEGGLITVPDFRTNDAQKAIHYYFCENDLTTYKKVITSKGFGYYDPPKLNCSQ